MDGYVILEWKKVKTQFPEFQKTLAKLEDDAIALATLRWTGFKYVTAEAFQPKEEDSGRTTIPPWLFADENNDVLDKLHMPATWGRNNFRQYYSSTLPAAFTVPGWKTILQGALLPATTEDVIIALAGYLFPDPTILVSKIRHELGTRRHVVVDVEELHGYEQPALIFEEGFVITPETHFLFKGWFEAEGYQRIVPLGFAIYRRKDSMISE